MNGIASQGRIKFLKVKEGYGFVVHHESQYDIMFEVSALLDQVAPGDEVAFTIVETEKGLRATEIRKQQ